MRKRPLLETVRNTFALHILLTDASNDLRNVDERTLTSGCHHGLDRVSVLIQRRLSRFTGMVTCCVQHLIHKLFKRFNHRTSRLNLQCALLPRNYEIFHLLFSFVDRGLNLAHSVFVSHSVCCSDGERRLEHPVID